MPSTPPSTFWTREYVGPATASRCWSDADVLAPTKKLTATPTANTAAALNGSSQIFRRNCSEWIMTRRLG